MLLLQQILSSTLRKLDAKQKKVPVIEKDLHSQHQPSLLPFLKVRTNGHMLPSSCPGGKPTNRLWVVLIQ